MLYFESRSGDTNALALADGLTEEIINRLTGVERLTVRSRYLVRRYRGAALEDPASVGRGVNTTYLVTGTVRRSGGRLRVSTELVRAAGGTQVWAQQFDQASGDVFAVQEEVARDVATGIVGRLLPAETRTLAVRPTASAEAFDAYTLGRLYWNKRTAPDLVRAAQYFQQAIRAIALAPRLGEAYASLGEILTYRGRSAEAGRAFAQGVALSPRSPWCSRTTGRGAGPRPRRWRTRAGPWMRRIR